MKLKDMFKNTSHLYICLLIALVFFMFHSIYIMSDDQNSDNTTETDPDAVINSSPSPTLSDDFSDSDTFELIYDFNGGQNSESQAQKNCQYANGTEIKIWDPTIDNDTHELDIKKDGYYFLGWQTTSDYSDGNFYNPGEKIILNRNMTLYARWSNYLFLGGEQKNSDGKYSFCQTYLCPNGIIIPFAYEMFVGGENSGKYYCQYYDVYSKAPNENANPKSNCTGLRLKSGDTYKSFLVGNSTAAFSGSNFGNADRYYKDFENKSIIGEWDLTVDNSSDLLFKIIISYDGLKYVNVKYEVSNKTDNKIFKDLKLVHGSDTYFYGADSGISFYSALLNMVYLKNENYNGLMCFYGDEYSKPSHYFAGSYSEQKSDLNNNFASNGKDLLDKVADSAVDNAFYLQWNFETLGPGETWKIGMIEGYTEPKILLNIIGAPIKILKGQSARYNARIQNFGISTKTVNLEVLSEHGFETKIFDINGNEIESLEISGQNAYADIIIEQYIPEDTEYISDELTLKLTDGDTDEQTETSVKTTIMDEIKVVYYGNGNISGQVPEVQNYSVGEEICISENTGDLYKGEAYNFYGWATDPYAQPGDENIYLPNDFLVAKKDVMLYAIYQRAVIKSQTQSLEVEYGNDLEFSVQPYEEFSDSNLEYKWYRNGEEISGDGSVLTISQPEVRNSGDKYYCVILGTDDYGNFSVQSKVLELKVRPRLLNMDDLSITNFEESEKKGILIAEIARDILNLMPPAGEVEFTVNGNKIGKAEIKRVGDKYYSEIEWQADEGGNFVFQAEYIAAENDNYKKGEDGRYELVISQPLDIKLSCKRDAVENGLVEIIAEIKNIIDDFGVPAGEVEFTVSGNKIGKAEIKKVGDKYYSEIEWQTDEVGSFVFQAEYIAIENDNYVTTLSEPIKSDIEFYSWDTSGNYYSKDSEVNKNQSYNIYSTESGTQYILKDILKAPSKINKSGFIHGYPDNSFKPDAFITRAEVAQITFNLIQNNLSIEGTFNYKKYDDLDNHWVCDAVKILSGKNIMVFDSTNFNPDQYISIEEFARVISEIFMYLDNVSNNSLINYAALSKSLDDKINKELVFNRLVLNEILRIFNNVNLGNKRNITRAEAVCLIFKLFNFDTDNINFRNKYFIDVPLGYWAYKNIMQAAS